MKTTPVTSYFLDRFHALYPAQTISAAQRPLSIRVNTIRSDTASVQRKLEEQAVPYRTVAWYPDALILPEATVRQLDGTGLVQSGEIYIQSLSSMIPVLVLAPTRIDRILDMAAAPGSKTSQLSALMENRGEISANDIDKRRLYKLKAVLDMTGAQNVSVTSLPGQALWRKYPEVFDKVLLDAPCSMEGASYYPSGKKIRDIAKLQRWLLRSAISAAKPGGVIVYSTCSMAPEENEEVVDWVMEKEKGKIEFSPIDLSVPEAKQGITSWQGRDLDSSLVKTIRIPPSDKMEQFFVAKIVKRKSTIPQVLQDDNQID